MMNYGYNGMNAGWAIVALPAAKLTTASTNAGVPYSRSTNAMCNVHRASCVCGDAL